jgi:hypothetical protein
MPTPERRRSTWLTRRLPLALVASSFTWLLYTRFYLVQNPSLGPEIGFDARYAFALPLVAPRYRSHDISGLSHYQWSVRFEGLVEGT